MFFSYGDIAPKDLGAGVSRKVLAYDDEIMMVEVSFEKGAVGAEHSHEIHDQATYILEGVFEFTVDGKKYICRKGDTLYKKANVLHGAVCLEKGKLLDVFNPKRDEFLD